MRIGKQETIDAKSLADGLRSVVAEPSCVTTGSSVVELHSRDLGPYYHRADVVVFAESVEDVSAVLAYANVAGVPVTPYGAGTSNGGLTVPLRGGISLDVSRLDRIVSVHPEDFTATVEAGVLRNSLNERLGAAGLWFPVDPGANASLGGMAATNASGTTSVRYGSMRGNVRALRVVLADGSVVRTGTRARKSSAGYDLTSLFVGSEGTLGVVVEVTLRVYPIPEKQVAVRASFADVEDACRAVIAMSGAEIGATRMELLDGPTIAIVNAHRGTEYAEAPTLFLEVAGAKSSVDGDLATVQEICTSEGGLDFTAEHDPTAQAALWRDRHEFAHALIPRHPGKSIVGTDICVPVSELHHAVAHARKVLADHGVEAVLLAHAGDGNYHLACMIDPNDPRDGERFDALYSELVDDALARGGTCTGEHGIGIRKIPFLEREHGDLLPSMRAVKNAFDPGGILNPGKIFTPS